MHILFKFDKYIKVWQATQDYSPDFTPTLKDKGQEEIVLK